MRAEMSKKARGEMEMWQSIKGRGPAIMYRTPPPVDPDEKPRVMNDWELAIHRSYRESMCKMFEEEESKSD